MKSWLSKIRSIIKFICYQIATEWRIKYRIVELDIKKQRVIFNVKRRSLILKYNFSEVINEMWIIEALAIEEAALLGYFYGRCYRLSQANKQSISKPNTSSLLLKNNTGIYKILYHQRDGNIAYTDCHTQESFLANPYSIIRNPHVLNKFDPTQAFYIGILAGFNLERTKMHNIKPCLKIVS